jgi:hypothetical protein
MCLLLERGAKVEHLFQPFPVPGVHDEHRKFRPTVIGTASSNGNYKMKKKLEAGVESNKR